MERWWILSREGKPVEEGELPERPDDSNPADGEAFRPWYKQDEHLHIENGAIVGIHGRGTLAEVQQRLRRYLKNESELIQKFGKNEDILLPDLDRFLAAS